MRLLLKLLAGLAALSLTACASSGGVPRPFPGAASPPTSSTVPTPPVAPPGGGSPAITPPSELIVNALQLRGTPYRFGGSDPAGFDCSGFVQWVFNSVGVSLPREVRDQYRVGEVVDLDSVQPGDLVFFETVSEGASHVGMAVGNTQFVHAPSSRGVVRVESYGTSYWATRFVGARRIAAVSTAD